jgi:hypothetical protein
MYKYDFQLKYSLRASVFYESEYRELCLQQLSIFK